MNNYTILPFANAPPAPPGAHLQQPKSPERPFQDHLDTKMESHSPREVEETRSQLEVREEAAPETEPLDRIPQEEPPVDPENQDPQDLTQEAIQLAAASIDSNQVQQLMVLPLDVLMPNLGAIPSESAQEVLVASPPELAMALTQETTLENVVGLTTPTGDEIVQDSPNLVGMTVVEEQPELSVSDRLEVVSEFTSGSEPKVGPRTPDQPVEVIPPVKTESSPTFGVDPGLETAQKGEINPEILTGKEGNQKIPEEIKMPVAVAEMPDPGGGEVIKLNNQPEPARLAEARYPEFVSQINNEIVRLTKIEKNTLSLKLHPEELGRIDLRLTTGSNGTQVTIVADTSSTGMLLERHLTDLKNSLLEAGISLGELTVGYGDDHNQSAETEKQSQSNKGISTGSTGQTPELDNALDSVSSLLDDPSRGLDYRI